MVEKIGMNLEEVTDWGASVPYIDLVMQGREWRSIDPWPGTGAWDDGRPINLDENGWVSSIEPAGLNGTTAEQQLISFLTMTVSSNYTEGEEWKCTWEGYGGTKFSRNVNIGESDANIDMDSWEYDAGTNTGSFEFTMHPSKSGIRLKIGNNDGNWDDDNYPRNIKVYPVALEAQLNSVYHPDFLATLEGVEVIRTMGIVYQNRTTITDWDSRPLNTWYSRATKNGIPIEDCVAIANLVGADMMYSYPTSAIDGYVTAASEYFRDNLNGKLYVEWGNEPWNDIFPQAHLCTVSGQDMFDTGNDNLNKLKYYGYRSAEIFDLVETVYGATTNIVRVLNSQQTNTWTGQQMLGTAYGDGTVADKTDAIMIAPYFGGQLGTVAEAPTTKGYTLDQLFDVLSGTAQPTGNFSLADARNNMLDYKTLADSYNIRLFAYEGGHHLAGATGGLQSDSDLTDLFRSAVQDPRMAILYENHLNDWEEVVGDLYCMFLNTGHQKGWPLWGIREYRTQPREDSPMLDGWLNWVESLSAGEGGGGSGEEGGGGSGEEGGGGSGEEGGEEGDGGGGSEGNNSPGTLDINMTAWNTFGSTPKPSPIFQKDYKYANAITVSGNGTANNIFSAVGASAMILPPVEGHAYIVWGWHVMFQTTDGGTSPDKKELLIDLTDIDADHKIAVMSGSPGNGGTTSLSQPLRTHANTGVFMTAYYLRNWEASKDSATVQIYYSLINGYDSSVHA